MRRSPTPLLLLAAALAAATAAAAQSIHWDPPGGTLPAGEVSSLRLVFDDCSPDDTPSIPKVEGLRLDYQGQSNSYSIINGSFSRDVSMTYSVLISGQQGVDIPEFTIKTNKGPIKVPAAHFGAAGATVGSSGISLGEAAAATLTPSPDAVWAGEVFDLKYSIDVAAGYYPSWGRGSFEWDPSPLVTEDWSQPEPFETHEGSARTGLSYHTRAIASTAGRVRLNPTSQLISLNVGVTGFGFFQQRQYQQFAVPDSPVSIEVRPLPPAPAGFTGSVGAFSITSKVVPLEVKVGEPITWTVELTGSGNWPEIRGLPSREAPSDFQVIQPKPKRTQPQGKLFEGTLAEDVVLVPTKPGSYVLPPLEFTYFDPRSGSYKTISAPGATVVADPAAPAPAVAAPETAAAPGAPSVSASAPTTEAKPPEPPAGALGDPVPKAAPAAEPLRKRTLAAACAVPFALLLLFWAVLAYRRARATDPLGPRRAARRRLASTLEALKASPAAGKTTLLIEWQKDSAVLWGIDHAAPPPAALGDAEWAGLWAEADRFLYSADAVLPADWAARAQAALSKKTLRPFSPLRLFLPGNLIPLLVLLLAASAPRLSAADGTDAYRRLDFAAAEKEWGAQVAANPLDWSARHNLSLALAQQDRWGEAAAQAAAAFVQSPSGPATRRQLVITGDKAGFMPEPLDVLVQQGPVESLARLKSPGDWQRIGVAAAALFAAALALLLASAHRAVRRRWALPTAAAALVVALLAGAASLVAYRAYGITADTRAVIVWRTGILRSVPTEADVSQKTTALPAGSTAIADKAFLGWIRLSFPNGQTGWVLRSEAVYLWRSPPG
jgi:BatD DUF11 like domain